MKKIIVLFALTFSILASLCAEDIKQKSEPTNVQKSKSESKKGDLQKQLTSILSAEDFESAFWGAYVIKENGEILFDQDGKKWFIPASNMKIYSTSSIIDILGKDYKYITKLEAVGKITKQGVLEGDLVITGSGDPSFCSRQIKNGDNYVSLFKKWAESLKKNGITSISGDIIGDGRIFGDQYYSNGCEVDDLAYYYSAGSSGLAIEENTFRYTFTPGKNIGDKISISINPDTKYVTLINDAVTTKAGGPTDADIVWRGSDSNTARIAGVVALDKAPFEQSGSVWDSSKYAAFLMIECLEKEGIKVSGSAKNITDSGKADKIDNASPEDKRLIAVHESQPLSDLVKVCNKISYNFYADMFLRTLGYKMKGVGTYENGRDAVRDWLKSIGAPDGDKVMMVDGSGLSRRDSVQPRQSVGIFKYMLQKSKSSKEFIDSLAIAGVDGDISYRLKGTRAEGNLRAKSGYINNVRSLSGFVKDADGETLIFSFMVNQSRVDMYRMDEVIDQACKALADYSEK